MKKIAVNLLMAASLVLMINTSCSDDDDSSTDDDVSMTDDDGSATDDDGSSADLEIPDTYTSTDFDTNVTAENTVVDELADMTSDANAAEANAQMTMVGPIAYPATLESVTLDSYGTLIENWLVELVAAANSPDGFQTPAIGEVPSEDQDGGLLGTRLLDEFGLELEQMVQKGSFGAALYNHAITVVNGIKNGSEGFTDSGAIDRLVEIHGTEVTFDPTLTTAAATYSRRRSDLTAETGFFYDIETNLITAKAAMEAGSDFDDERDAALDAYLLNWEESNYATVIYYANATIEQLNAAFLLEEGEDRDVALGDALHAYAEGVAFTHGFKGVSIKEITDDEIDDLLELFLAPEAEDPESYRFINEPTLLTRMEDIIDEVQDIYGFTDAEVESFFVNNNP